MATTILPPISRSQAISIQIRELIAERKELGADSPEGRSVTAEISFLRDDLRKAVRA